MTDKPKTKRSLSQNNSIHKGCGDIADTLVEHGISLQVFLQHLDVRPTKESIFAIFRSMAISKYEVTTSKLNTNQINPIWDELIEGLAKTTGVEIEFPSRQNFLLEQGNYGK